MNRAAAAITAAVLAGSGATAAGGPPAELGAIDTAIRRGVEFLLADQNPDGSWGAATRTKGLNIYAPLPGAHHAFRAGSSGLALAGLLDSGDPRPDVAAAIQRAEGWTLANLPKLRRADQTTTYNAWGHAYGLRALSRLGTRAANDPQKLARLRATAQQQIDLLNRYEELNGGWGYLDVFDGFTSQRPSGLPTAFTTATVLLAMREARDSLGVKLDDKTVRHALDGIVRQRTPDFSYVYAYPHRIKPRAPINQPAGSIGRSQVCNAALRRFGDTAVTDAVIRGWAERFLQQEPWFDIARKRPVPHESKFSISGYFYYYGVFYFTEAVSLLPREHHAAFAKRLAAVVLRRQEKDGSWWDYPLYSYHQSYGTGYALMALAWCREAMQEH